MNARASWLTAGFAIRASALAGGAPMNPILSGTMLPVATRGPMPVRRKIFRIEESVYHLARDPAPAPAAATGPRDIRARVTVHTPVSRGDMERAKSATAHAYNQELGLIQAAVDGARGAMAELIAHASDQPDAGRLARELAAIVADAERSANTILQAVEDIDRIAADLSASVHPGRESELANDIRCHVGQILEACGFHDLTGQRVAKVQAALSRLEVEIARLMEIWSGMDRLRPFVIEASADDNRAFLNGPRLDGDGGHYSQDDVDAVFARA
jgi:chemotaxis protein CheZ